MSHKRGIFYKATISNVGGQAITGAQFSESLDPINIFQNDLLDAPAGEIAIGSTKEIIYSYDVTQADISAGVVTAVASLSADAPVEPVNATISTTSISLDDGILITKQITSNPIYIVNETPIQYKIIVRNLGDNALTGVVVTDSLIDDPGEGTIQNIVDTSNVLTTGAALAHDENAILTFEYIPAADDSDITNIAYVISNEVPGPIYTDPVTVPASDIVIAPAIINIEAAQGDQVFLPVLADANTLFVDWYDDGNLSDAYSNEFPSHTYNDVGGYTGQVKVYGTASAWTGASTAANGQGSESASTPGSEKGYWPWIKAIVSWGELGAGLTHIDLQGVYGLSGGTIDPALPASVTSLEEMFRHWGSETIPDITGLVTSSVTDMNHMFFHAETFNQPIGSWNTSAVTDMQYMFYNADAFNQDISGWDTSSVLSMGGMFHGATAFNRYIGTWDTSSVLGMGGMFSSTSFNQDISGWDTGSVKNMSEMFYNAPTFNQDISSWNTSAVINMNSMFYNAVAFNQDISSWNTSAVTDIGGMFNGAAAFNQDVSSWNTSSVKNMIFMFSSTSAFNNGGVALDWADTSSVENMSQMFQSASAFDQDISGWDISAVTSMVNMFWNATSWSTENYDLALLAFAAQTVQPGVEWTNTHACREIEIPTEFTNAGWTISDGGICVATSIAAPAHYWDLNNTSTGQLDSAAGTGTDSDLEARGINSPQLANDGPGTRETSVELDKASSRSLVSNSLVPWNGGNSWSVSGWVKNHTFTASPSNHMFFNYEEQGDLFCRLMFEYDSDTGNTQYDNFIHGGASYFRSPTGTNDINTGTWYHLVYAFDYDNNPEPILKIYKNGVFEKSYFSGNAAPAAAPTVSMEFRIGGVNTNTWNLDANVFAYGMWDGVLKPSEIKYLYNNGDGKLYNELDITP